VSTSYGNRVRSKVRLLAALIGLSAFAVAPVAAAAASADTELQIRQSRRIEIHVVGPETAVLLVRETATELFQRHGIQVDVVGPQDHTLELDGEPLAIATLRLQGEKCNLLIMNGVGNEIARRDLSQQTSVETSIEAAAHIIYFVVDTLIGDQQIGKAKQAPRDAPRPSAAPARLAAHETEATPKSKPTPDTPVAKGAYDLGAFFSTTSLGASRTLAGGGIWAGARLLTPVQVGIVVAASTHAASELEFQGASALVRPSSVKTLAVLELPIEKALSFSLAAGPGLTWLSVAPNRSTSDVEAAQSRSLLEPIFSLAAGLRVNLSRYTFVSALAGTDLSLAQQHFVAESENQRQMVLATPRVRPLLMLAACASLEGPSGFSPPPKESP
jgi:hypothetical protein